MLARVNHYARSHAFYINWYVSLLGAAGLGHLVLQKLQSGLMLSIALVMSMACVKSYIFQVTSGRPVVPTGKSTAYMVAWWLCFGLLAGFMALMLAVSLAFVLYEGIDRLSHLLRR
jgi:hypothetical protein